jgi:hypothetical protein
MFRQALLAAILVSGTAAAVAAQSDEFPFRRFGSRDWVMPRFEVRPYRFSLRDNERFRERADRLRVRLEERRDELANRTRLREFDSRDLALRMRNRAFAMRDDLRRHQMEFRDRDMDRVRDRIRDRMDHFRFERPLILRRHSRTI